MKTLLLTFVTCVATTVAFADNDTEKPRKRTVQEIMRSLPGYKPRPSGGYVVKGYNENIIAIRDGQTAYKPEEIETVLHGLRLRMGLPVFRLAMDAKRDKIGAEVELVDDFSFGKGRSIVSAPEESWAKMSVKRLVADNPDDTRRLHRLKVEIFRSVMMAVGVGFSFYQPCLMTNVRSVADIDAVRVEKWTPYTEGCYDAIKGKLGIGRVLVATYRMACKQGWAPKPENEVQRKIWEEIMSIPENPIVIEKK